MIRPFFRWLRKSERGSVSAEFAVSITVIIALLTGGVEFGRYVLVRQKLDRAATTASDLVARSESLSTDQLGSIFSSTKEVMTPYDFGTKGLVIVSMVTQGDGVDEIVWQRSGGGTFSKPSVVGVEGDAATLPSGFSLRDGESVVIAEVHYRYNPMILGSFLGVTDVYHIAYFRPRFGATVPLDE
jgi:Flp pilus assembly protein TadG